jgi:hypothetical protein
MAIFVSVYEYPDLSRLARTPAGCFLLNVTTQELRFRWCEVWAKFDDYGQEATGSLQRVSV